MIYTTDSIELDGKIYSATKVDYESYETQSGSILLDGVTYTSYKVVGKESAPTPGDEYEVTQTILEDGTSKLTLNSHFTSRENVYKVESIELEDGTQQLKLTRSL